MTCNLKTLKDVNEDIGHIHEHGSADRYCIATEDIGFEKVFLCQLDRSYIFKKMVDLIHIQIHIHSLVT